MNVLVLLLGCTDGGPLNRGDVATYDLTLQVLSPTNQSPLAGVDTVKLILEHAVGEPEEYELSSTSGSPQITGLGDLEDTVLALEGWSGDTLVSFGRSQAVTAHDETDLTETLLVSEVDQFGWMTLMERPLSQATLVADGRGTFWSFGGDRGTYRVTGAGGSNPIDTIYRLDTAPPDSSLAFVETGSLPSQESEFGGSFSERVGMSGTLLTGTAQDAGLILLAGGHLGGIDFTTTTRNALLFDPSDGSFIETENNLRAARTYHVAVEMASGDVALYGGWGSDASSQALARQDQVEIYRRAERKFEKAGETGSYGPGGHAASLGGDGVLYCGGWISSGDDVYRALTGCVVTTITGETSSVEPLPVGLSHHTLVSLGEGRALVVGGVTFEAINQNEAEDASAGSWIYEASTDSWTDAGDLNQPRAAHQAVTLPDGRVLVVGGTTKMGLYDGDPDDGGEPLACAEVWTEGEGWEPLGSCSSASSDTAEGAYWPMIAQDSSYGVLVVGGLGDGNSPTSAVSLWPPAP
jgi:hypothetical protein